ncbi:MAG: type II secretion system F family protein [Sulfuricurvum sp.]|uniref:type II secretion system F family protein n=1 Tax=Sulfuricurvum sp. TaxID=2025608 RepID=UPI00261F58A4|nr:type II secretion system F family protein [Sulfuricurvum sp.]MDD2828328.1 type II secretion system F family protein [Sulfuricurvum sp.]MDD4949717.1 type II secretion system F family protein [Sulfuricurvum sp.]
MEFHYKGLDNAGNPLKSTIEASSYEDAKIKLKSLGILYSDISMREQSFFGVLALFKQKSLPSSQLAILSRDLAVYLNAGIPLTRALSLLKHQNHSNVRLERFFESLVNSIHEGKSFAQSLESQEHYTLPVFYTGTLKISEDRGILAEVLNELSHYLILQEKVKKQLSQALVYPSFIIVVSILMISFMLTVVVPKITAIFESTGQALPMLTQIIISLAHFFAQNWFFLASGVLGAVGLFSYKMATDYTFKKGIHALILKLPIVGKMVETADLARFCTISSLLMRSGIPVVNTIKLSCITLSSEVIKALFQEASVRVVEGSSLSKALKQEGTYTIDDAFIEAVAIGEETSELSSMLEHLSAFYIDTNKDKIALFLSVLEPSLMLIIGGIIGVMVTAMLLPIFSLNLG